MGIRSNTSNTGKIGTQQIFTSITYILLYILSNIATNKLGLISSNPQFSSPWYPPAAFTVVLLFCYGIRYVIAALIAQYFLALVIFQLPLVVLIPASIIPLGYFTIAVIGRRFLNIDLRNMDLRSVTAFILLILTGTFIIGLTYNLFPLLFGFFPKEVYFRSVLNYSVGDTIGIVIFAPLLVKIIKYVEYRKQSISEPYLQSSPLHLVREKSFLIIFVFLQLVVVLIAYLYDLNVDVVYLLFIPLFVFTLQYNYTGAVIGSFLINTELIFLLSIFNIEVNELLILQFFMLILSTSGLIMGIVIRERIEIRDELIELEYMLEQSHTMENLGRLSSGIAHDFKNILFVISTQAELMTTFPEQSPELIEIIETIENSVERANLLVNQITSLHAPVPSELKQIDLNHEITMLLPLIRNLLGKIYCDYVNYSPQSVIMASQVIIQQILLNLIVNARDAIITANPNTETGEITISLRSISTNGVDQIELEIADNGPGIPESLKKKIFQPYFTQKQKGSGLGLSIVEGHVNLLNGQVSVFDNIPQGAKFILLFDTINEKIN